MSFLLLLDSASPPGADISFNGPMLALPYSLQRLGFTYVRNSLKTVYQGGSLVTLSANQFGTTYDAVTGLHAFEAEPAATNLALNSIFPGSGVAPIGWSGGGVGTSGPAVSIYGSASSAQAWTQTATANRPFLSRGESVAANTTYTLSYLVESVTAGISADNAILAIGPAGATVAYPACTANPSGGGAGIIGAGELKLTITTAATAGTCTSRIGLGCNANITGTIQFSRPQLETGLRRTSWIATAGATATRAADVLSDPTANIPGFNAAGYTLVVDGRMDVVPVTTQYLASVTDGTTNNRASVLRSATATQNMVSSGGVVQANQNTPTAQLTRLKIASSFSENSILFAAGGVAASADTTALMPVSPTTLHIGSINGGLQTNGFIYRVRLIPTALNQAQTTGLTV